MTTCGGSTITVVGPLGIVMEKAGILLCVFVGHFVAAHSAINNWDATFPQEFPEFPGFFDNPIPSPFKRNFAFTPYDTIFSSWQTRSPDFHMLGEWPSILNVPRVEVFCDESRLTVRVGKTFNGAMMTGEEMQLGDGCYRNGELPNQFVFIYSLDECGTSRVVQNGMEMFTNTLHMNLKKFPHTWWQTPSTVHISCMPNRPHMKANLVVPTPPPEYGTVADFVMEAVNSLWTGPAESNVYKRGQVINLQLSANTRPEQQLFIQSCFVSASPEPHTRPRHGVIIHNGCAAPLGSPRPVAQFVASDRADVVNFVLNTSYLMPQLYVHCSVVLSDQGVTFGSKSCNYNAIHSRWEELSGVKEVCECCSSRCKGLSVNIPTHPKAIVGTGPFVVVDRDAETGPVSETQVESRAPVTETMQSDGAAIEDTIVAGASTSRSRFSSPPQGVVVVSQDPSARLTLWLSGQIHEAKHGEIISSESEKQMVQVESGDAELHDLPEQQPSTNDQEPKIRAHDVNVVTLAMISPHLEKEAVSKESRIKTWLARHGLLGVKSRQEVNVVPPDEMTVDIVSQDDFNQNEDKPLHRLHTNDAGPVIRSKLQFSKSTDGTKTLSYEEEMVKEKDDRVAPGWGLKRKQELRQRKLRSTFLDMLRRMDCAE